MKNTKLFAVVTALLVLASCQTQPNVPQSSEAVNFSTAIGEFNTRAADNYWHAGDEVGIYMVEAGAVLDENALAVNKKYTTTGTNRLAPATTEDEVYYPDNGDDVDFIAYYPWKTDIADFTFPVNVAVQSPLAAIDLLYSDNAKGYNKGDFLADMSFSHELAKLVLNIVDLTEEISAPAVTIEALPTTADFSLVDGTFANAGNPAAVEMVVSEAGENAFMAEAIVIPNAEAEYVLVFQFGSKATRLPITVAFDASKKYVYTVNVTDKVLIDGDGEIIDWDEIPGEDLDFDVKELALPLVYKLEKPAEEFPLPPFPTADELAALHPDVDFITRPDYLGLPDIFKLSNGTRITQFSQWEQRRAEIMAYLGNYEQGMKPGKPESVVATMSGNQMRVAVTHNGVTLTLTTNVTMPTGANIGPGPYPVAIGMNGGANGTLAQGCIRIQVSNGQLGRGAAQPFGQMYPDLAGDLGGDYIAWSWGVSRLIDGLEQLVAQGLVNADLEHIATFGCSYAGKESLYAGALDERIALTVVQESGGGGINSWRISDQAVIDNTANGDTEVEVERINNTNYSWFSPKLKDFQDRSCLLPFDHHELIALIAPRAVLIHGNPDYVWMADKGGFTSMLAAYEVWKAMGIEARFGWDFSDTHGHCSLPASQTAAVTMFRDKFLFGIDGPTETVRKDPADRYMYGKSQQPDVWIAGWKDHTLN